MPRARHYEPSRKQQRQTRVAVFTVATDGPSSRGKRLVKAAAVAAATTAAVVAAAFGRPLASAHTCRYSCRLKSYAQFNRVRN